MREITVKLYQYDELSDKAKERALEWLGNDQGMKQEYEWEYIQEDAETVGLIILELSNYCVNKGKFVDDARECARRIMTDHGKTCATYKTAAQFIDALEAQDADTIEETEKEFLRALLEDYRIMFNESVEYAYSHEALEEDMRANDYEFTEEGKRG
jgi:hypothetical protein